ncbi:MAG TPA: N-acetyltransferase [Pyrinomonadaceae bacterium]|jgi:GNAT superfamily N-acetyltransferase|nr:N-acetyltransferase [Pyrinomonadaceae bacterium]
MLEIRKATQDDWLGIWPIIKTVIAGGDTYTIAPDASEEEMRAMWYSPEKHTYVAVWTEAETVESSPEVLGTFFLKANQSGPGAHIGNAGYMVSPEARGKGVGRRMGEWSLDEARALGFSAMQFNFVVKSNKYAVKLWQDIGFEIIGEIPDAFDHRELGLVNAYIMYRKL